MRQYYLFFTIIIGVFIISACKELAPVPFVTFDADFNAPSIVREGDTIKFFSASSTVGAKSFSWNFGIDTVKTDTSNLNNPEYIYKHFGSYSVKMKVSIQKTIGLVNDSITKTIIVLPATKIPDSTKTYGSIIEDESGFDIAPLPTKDGYVILGRRGLNILYLLKTDLDFNIQDTLEVAYLSNQQVYGKDIKATQDGGYLIVGYITSSPSDNDAFIVKVDATGESEWSEIINSAKDEYYVAVEEDSDGNFVVTGSTKDVSGRSVIEIDKYSSNGTKLYAYTVPNCTSCKAEGMGLSFDGEGTYMIVGVQIDNPLIIKFTEPNTIVSKRVLDNVTGTAKSIIPLSDGRFAIAGSSYATNTDSTHAFIAKVDLVSKSVVWLKELKMYKESFSDLIEIYDEDDNLKVVALGKHFNPLSNEDALIAKYNSSDGTEEAVKLLGNQRNNDASRFILNSLNEFIIVGSTANPFSPLQKKDVLLFRYKSNFK